MASLMPILKAIWEPHNLYKSKHRRRWRSILQKRHWRWHLSIIERTVWPPMARLHSRIIVAQLIQSEECGKTNLFYNHNSTSAVGWPLPKEERIGLLKTSWPNTTSRIVSNIMSWCLIPNSNKHWRCQTHLITYKMNYPSWLNSSLSPTTRPECRGQLNHKLIELESEKGHVQSRDRANVKSWEDSPVGKVVPRINNKIQIFLSLVEIKSLLMHDLTAHNLQNEIIKRVKDHWRRLISLIARSQVWVFMARRIESNDNMKPYLQFNSKTKEVQKTWCSDRKVLNVD